MLFGLVIGSLYAKYGFRKTGEPPKIQSSVDCSCGPIKNGMLYTECLHWVYLCGYHVHHWMIAGSSLFSYARTVCALGGRVRMLGLDDILYSHDVPWVILSGQMHIKYRENTHRGPRKKPSWAKYFTAWGVACAYIAVPKVRLKYGIITWAKSVHGYLV